MKRAFQNIVDINVQHPMFKHPDCKYSVTSRRIRPDEELMHYLVFGFLYIHPEQIDSLFGSTTEFTDFYGGRIYRSDRSLTERHLEEMAKNNIHLALTLTNHFFTPALYEKNKAFLEKYHQNGQIIICTSDELAMAIRRDFPNYRLRASIIKNLNTREAVSQAMDLYDDVVIPMDMNDDDDFLLSLPEKDRVMLFANAACAYTCPNRICYRNISKVNQQEKTVVKCMKKEMGNLDNAKHFFNVEKFRQMGYSQFKLIL